MRLKNEEKKRRDDIFPSFVLMEVKDLRKKNESFHSLLAMCDAFSL